MAEGVSDQKHSGHTRPGPTTEGLKPGEDSGRCGCWQAEWAPVQAVDSIPDRCWKAQLAPSRSLCAVEGRVRLCCQANRERFLQAKQPVDGFLHARVLHVVAGDLQGVEHFTGHELQARISLLLTRRACCSVEKLLV